MGWRAGAGGQTTPPAPQAPDSDTAAISGVVSDAVTGRPIAGASVTLFTWGPTGPVGTSRPSVLTDARGRFVFVTLSSASRYNLFAARPGYVVGSLTNPETGQGGGAIRLDQDGRIVLASGEWLRDVHIRMSRPGSISGRVLDERGEPVVGTAVRVFARRLLAGREMLLPGAVASTDDRGAYRMAFVEPGQYFVAVLSVQATVPAATVDGPRALPLGGLEGRGSSSAFGPEVRGASIDVDGRHRLVLTSFATPPPPGGNRPRVYAPVFYPTGSSPTAARPIEIEAGTARADVDFQLTPVPAARVSGRVSGAPGAATMLLRLMATGSEHLGPGSEVATTLIEADGGFTFLNVPAGDYTLIASPSLPEPSSGSSAGRLPQPVGYGLGRGLGYSGGYPAARMNAMWWQSDVGRDVWGRAPVSVGDADVTGIDVPLRRATSVRGRLVFDDPSPPAAGARFTVQLEPANGDLSLGAPHATTAAGDSSYAVELTGLQRGRYLIGFRSPSFRGWLLKSVTAGGIELTDAGFDGALGQDYEGVVITLTRSSAELTGIVRDRNGRPTSGAVILFPADPKGWVDYGLTGDRLRSTRSASDGTYSIMSLRDDDYLVVALPSAQADAWRDPRALAAAAPHATRVTLAAGAPRTQDLRIAEVVAK
jgi:hypothetical protein